MHFKHELLKLTPEVKAGMYEQKEGGSFHG